MFCHFLATVLSSLIFISPFIYASNPGDPGEMLSFGAGARSLGMGTAYTAIAQDATSAYWNPAGLAAVRRNEFNALEANLYGGATYNYLGYAGLRAGPGVIGGHLARLGISGAEERDVNNNLLGSFGYNETDFGVGYGMVFPRFPTLGLGVAGNLLSRNLNGSSDRLMGLDVASQYAMTDKVGLGLVVKNALRFSQGDTDDKLPQAIRLGVGYQPIRGLTLSGDLENFTHIFLGAEYTWGLLAGRVGFEQNSPTFGMGLHWKDIAFDFAMATSQDLGSSERLSLSYAFGKPKGSDNDYNVNISAINLEEQANSAIEKGYYAEAERLLRSARRVKPDNHDLQDRLERLALVTPHVRSAVGWDRANKLARQGINEFINGKNVDALWRMTYAYSVDKGQSGLLRVIENVSRLTNYQVSLYDPTSPLTLTQQVLAQALVDFRAQHYDETVNLCQRVISLESNNSLAYKRLGSALYALHQFDAAKTAWQKAMAYEPDPAAKEQLKTFVEMARTSALGLPANMPGGASDQSDEVDLENDIGQNGN